MLIAGISGFIALGFEIAWFRVFELASRDRAPAFALLLSTYLAGIAAGSYVAENRTKQKIPAISANYCGASPHRRGLLRVLAAARGPASVEREPIVRRSRPAGSRFNP